MIKDSKRPNGKGNLSDYGNGKVRLRIMIGRDKDGKPVYATATGKDEDDCLKKIPKSIKKNKSKVANYSTTTSIMDFHKITLSDLCTAHLDYKLSKKDQLKPKSADRIEGTIKNQIDKYDIGMLQVSVITSNDIEDHIEYLISNSGLSISTIKKTFDVINAAFKWAITRKYLKDAENPCTMIREDIAERFKKLKDRYSTTSYIIVLSIEECLAFVAEAGKVDANGRPVYLAGFGGLLLLETGMRVGELCALRVKDFNEKEQTLRIYKTRGRAKNRDNREDMPATKVSEGTVKNDHYREIKLTDKAAAIINKIIANLEKAGPNDYIIVNSKGNPMDATSFGRALNTIYRHANLDPEISGAHVLRRTFATNEHKRGVETIDIAAYIGDTPETVIKHYISPCTKIRDEHGARNIIEVPVSKAEKASRTSA